MKVLELVLKWSRGGVGRYVSDLTTTARYKGFDCRIATIIKGDVPVPDDVYGPLVAGGIQDVFRKGTDITSFISNGAYDVVHVHGNNGLVFYFAHLAQVAGAKVVVHSHNSSFGDGLKLAKSIFTIWERQRYSRCCEVKFACSRVAGDFLFDNTDYRIALNGVNVTRFAFSAEYRSTLRARLAIPEEATVIGFAANLIHAKNPLFALAVFKEFLKMQPKARFVVCGDGELLDELRTAASDLIERNQCYCVGHVGDIERYYSAMDLLLAPSKFEGLPINLIEAQASGLSIVMSDAISDDVLVVQELCKRLPLESGNSVWARSLFDLLSVKKDRVAAPSLEVIAAGYSQPDCFDVVLDAYRVISEREL